MTWMHDWCYSRDIPFNVYDRHNHHHLSDALDTLNSMTLECERGKGALVVATGSHFFTIMTERGEGVYTLYVNVYMLYVFNLLWVPVYRRTSGIKGMLS